MRSDVILFNFKEFNNHLYIYDSCNRDWNLWYAFNYVYSYLQNFMYVGALNEDRNRYRCNYF